MQPLHSDSFPLGFNDPAAHALAPFRLELGSQRFPVSAADPRDVTLQDDALHPGFMSFGVTATDSRILAGHIGVEVRLFDREGPLLAIGHIVKVDQELNVAVLGLLPQA